MIFRQFVNDDLGCASYLIGDQTAGVAAVVDPRLEVDEYLELARFLGVSLEHQLETHNHADHISGHGRLAAATGATIHIHREAGVDYAHDPFDDGWELELGSIIVRALHTPGHRPEHSAFALIDTTRGPEPWALLSGDSLFVNDVARPDLAVDADEGARGLFRSLRERLLILPAETEVWPGHLGGSLCGGPSMDMKVSSTVGFERTHNAMLTEEDEDRFVKRTVDSLGPQPPNFEAILAANRGPLGTHGVEVGPLTHGRSSRGAPTERCSSTSAPTCSSMRHISLVPSASPRCRRGSGQGSPGLWSATVRSFWLAATTRTRGGPRCWPPPLASASWVASWPGA